MRYYDFCLSTNAEQIKKNAKINLREYAYDNPIGAMNGFVGRNVKNGVNFLAYREEEKLKAIWSITSFREGAQRQHAASRNDL